MFVSFAIDCEARMAQNPPNSILGSGICHPPLLPLSVITFGAIIHFHYLALVAMPTTTHRLAYAVCQVGPAVELAGRVDMQERSDSGSVHISSKKFPLMCCTSVL